MGGLAMHGFLQARSAMQAERAAMVEAQMQADRARAAEMAARAGAEKLQKDRGK
jgi:alpha-D-ribose 1-methylphosphonate 5-triphosphate synthase subunit PhnG